MAVTASKLYDYLQCPHRVWRDQWGPQDEKDPEPNPFVQLLWERGLTHEKEQLAQVGEVVNIAALPYAERPQATLNALRAGAPLIYQGMLSIDELIGIPDFLRREADGSYVPIDVKSGMGVEGAESDSDEDGEPKLKKHYAVQLALYVDALKRLGFQVTTRGIILDIRGEEVVYDLNTAQGKRTLETYWELYERTREAVAALISGEAQNDPAMVGVCKLCPWYKSCQRWVEEKDDLTGLFSVGRKVRDPLVVDAGAHTISQLCVADIPDLLRRREEDKEFLKGVGEKTLEKAVMRAKIMRVEKVPVLYEEVLFPEVPYELFFDIEDDPTQDFVYMHGVYERSPAGERYLDFTATELSDEAERDAWARFWAYVRSLPQDGFAVYYFSKHERTTYRRMQERYPEIISTEELER